MSTGTLNPNVSLFYTDKIRQLVTNHFLHFLELDRSDPKKFQILQLIAALLGWSDGKHMLETNHRSETL